MTGPDTDGQPPTQAPTPQEHPDHDAVDPGRHVQTVVDAADGEPSAVTTPQSDAGPPGSGIFSLEGRRAPGLYLVAWVLTVAGLAVTLVLAPMATDPTWRPILFFLGAVATSLGLAAGAGSQILQRADRGPERYRGPAPILTFAVYLMALAAVGIVVINGLGVDPDEPAGFFINAIIQTGGYVVVVWLFAVRSDALSWPTMGWPTWAGSAGREVLRSMLSGALVMIPVTMVILVVGTLVALLTGIEEMPRQFPLSETAAEGAFVALATGLIVPIGEEVFFRGFALTAWMRDLGARAALIRSSVFFAALHLVPLFSADFAEGLGQSVTLLAVLLPVGFVFGWLFIRYGLMASISAHITYNSLLLLLMFLASKVPEPVGV